METKYSLTTLLNNLLKLQNNGYQIITKLSDVVSSNSDTVEVDIMDGKGVIQKVYVPSYGSLKNQIVKLEQDIKNISGVGDTSSRLQLSDGTFRKILVSSLQREAEDIKTMRVPAVFNKKENWFFESFLNPLLYVSFDLTNQIKFETEKIETARYILNLDTEEKLRVFSERFFNKDDIKFQEFVKILLDNNIKFFLDKDTLDLPPRTLRFSGNFTVTDVFDDTINEDVNGLNLQKRVLRVKLDKIAYNDNQSNFLATQQLKIGDSLVVNSQNNNTRYEILNIEPSTRTVSLRLIEGFDPILIGKDYLSFYGEDLASVLAEVPIGFNEYCVIFIKPIDPDSRIESINWSPGVGIYTNDLTITDPNTGRTVSLSSYYQNEVVDFGAFLYASVKDKTPSSIYGITPEIPRLIPEDFKVLQINEHLTGSGSFDTLQKLQSDKIRVNSQIQSLDKSIAQLKSKIQTTRYSSQNLLTTDNNELTRLINERSSQSTLYASIVDDINKISVSENVENLNPKYRIRGFFPIPEAKTSERTAPQEVIQFGIQYRYIKKDGSANQPQQIEFVDNNGQKRRGAFSPWVEMKTDIRKRRIDPNTGIASWMVEDVENSDAVNINQLDIPIQQGEAVEFKIKSISEAGWPITPLESEYSEVIRIDFPSEFESIPSSTSIVEQAKKEQVKIDLQSELVNLNLDQVSARTINQNGKFYSTDSLSVASGFLTAENNIISLFDKINQMDKEIVELRAKLERAKGVLVVRIVDEEGQEYKVEANSTVKIFAGNYRDQVASLSAKKGAIITKNYFIKIFNDSASPLQMYSRIFGSKIEKIVNSGNLATDQDFTNLRRYDLVPIGLSNPATISGVTLAPFINQIPEQSAQVYSQFINSRYKSIDGKKELYGSSNGSTAILGDFEYIGDAEGISSLRPTVSGNSFFIWNGDTDPTLLLNSSDIEADTYASNIFVHKNHPEIPTWIATGDIKGEYNENVRNSRLANIKKPDVNFDKQSLLFIYDDNKSSKISFSENDKYFIGPASVGAYLFLNPNDYPSLIVDGSESISVKNLGSGNSNAITIPVTFQYRMTDYFGVGDDGIGNIGGIINAGPNTNLEYAKTIGIDIYSNPIDGERFSFDLEISARYFSKSLISKDIPVRSFEAAIDELNNTVKTVSARTSRDA